MLYFFTGTDREKARRALDTALARVAKKADIMRITDASSVDDLRSALGGGGMFGGQRAVILDGVLANEEMRELFLTALPELSEKTDSYFLYEEKPDAATRKQVEKYAETSDKFDAAKIVKRGDIFVLASALSQGDKKALWVGYQRALVREEAPEAIHGVLFWGAKQMALSGQRGKQERGQKFVAELAELPHEARRQGLELEYALEHYLLGISKL